MNCFEIAGSFLMKNCKEFQSNSPTTERTIEYPTGGDDPICKTFIVI